MKTFQCIGIALAAVIPACEPAEGEGTLETRIYGEAFIEDGIPADVFNDGWSMSFTKYLVAIDRVSTDDAEDSARYLFDLTPSTGGDGQAVTALMVPSGAQHLGYRIAPGAAATAGNATEADRQMMADGGHALWVEGTATKGDAVVSFAWGFDEDTTYYECEVVAQVPADDRATTVITIHTDHILYDDLESTTPNTSFDLIAASDTDMDGTVTKEELLAKDISMELRYQVGSTGIDNLWDYMSALSRTVGHIDGEGECSI